MDRLSLCLPCDLLSHALKCFIYLNDTAPNAANNNVFQDNFLEDVSYRSTY